MRLGERVPPAMPAAGTVAFIVATNRRPISIAELLAKPAGQRERDRGHIRDATGKVLRGENIDRTSNKR